MWQYNYMFGRSALLLMLICITLTSVISCSPQRQSGYVREPKAVTFKPDRTPLRYRSLTSMAREVNIKVRMMPTSSKARRGAKVMRPTFITMHSTANHRTTATAMQHAKALNSGRLPTSWHFSVDTQMAVQHLPLNSTAWHAGTAAGNNNSIGIEMCESESVRGNHFRTWDRAAKLAALLMKRYNIPLRRVVPHYHWYGKNCPKPLLDNGRPGAKWAWYISRVDYYYRCLNKGVPNRT